MGWTSVRTWTAGEIVTAAIMNSAVRDNLAYLKGVGQVPTIQSGLIIDNTLGTEYLKIPNLTTVQRDALTPAAGMMIYNSTTTQFQKYENGAWRADLGFNSAHANLSGLTAGDDHTQYMKESVYDSDVDGRITKDAMQWTANKLLKGAGAGANPTEIDVPAEVIKKSTTTVNYNDSSPVTLLSAPIGTTVFSVQVRIVTAFNGTTPALNVGDATDPDGFAATAGINEGVANWVPSDSYGAYLLEGAGGSYRPKICIAAMNIICTLTLSGASAGQAIIYIVYITP